MKLNSMKNGLTRRQICTSALALAATLRVPAISAYEIVPPPLGMRLSQDDIAAGKALLTKYVPIDLHSHPGKFHADLENPTDYEKWVIEASGGGLGSFVEQTLEQLKAVSPIITHIAAVSDRALLGVKDKPLRIAAVREFDSGEAYIDHKRQLNKIRGLIREFDLLHIKSFADINDVSQDSRVGIIMSCEGADFLEGKLERVQEAHENGIRSIQLVHYHINELGDIQTDPPRHEGLSQFGKQVISEMNRLGLIIDMAHASEKAVSDAARLSSHPLVLSHSSLHSKKPYHPRHISKYHAQLIADTGGVIGAWPAGISSKSFADYVDEIEALIAAVGIDHVALGTDMDSNYRPVFNEYAKFYLIPAALFSRGYSEQDIAKIVSHNFLRVFKDVTKASSQV